MIKWTQPKASGPERDKKQDWDTASFRDSFSGFYRVRREVQHNILSSKGRTLICGWWVAKETIGFHYKVNK